jgi:hypothetical protein
MFYVSKVSLPFFFLAVFDLLYSLVLKSLQINVKIVWLSAVFGFIAHTIMSAMYQIVPNSQSKALKFSKLSYLVFFLSLLSSLSFYSFQTMPGSLLHLIASMIFLLHTALSIRNWQPPTVKFLGLGAFYLFLSSLFLLLHELGYVPFALAVHSLTLGFMLNVVVGVELAWIPMLYMEPLNVKLAKRLFYISLVALPPLLSGFYLMDYRLIALLSIFELSFVAYFMYILYSVFSQRRMPKEIPLVVRYFLFALFLLPFGLFIGVIMAGEGLVSYLIPMHFDLLVYGFTATTIMGGLAHLYPRIVYNWKFSNMHGVSISDLVDEKALRRLFPLVPATLAFMVFFDALGKPFSYLSSIPYLLLWLYFIKSLLIRAITFKPTS